MEKRNVFVIGSNEFQEEVVNSVHPLDKVIQKTIGVKAVPSSPLGSKQSNEWVDRDLADDGSILYK